MPKHPILAAGLFLGSIAILALPARAQDKTIKKVPMAQTTAVDGGTLYKQYCAVCHGVAGKGDGPAASALKHSPGDLTQLAKRNGGRFPEEKFLGVLKGAEPVAAHGSEDMPVWGPAFRSISLDPSLTQLRLSGLMNFLEKMQAK